MPSQLTIFFNSSGPFDPRKITYAWRDERGRVERSESFEEPFDIRQVFLQKGGSEVSDFDIMVSNPSHLYQWLQCNDVTKLSTLQVFSSVLDYDDTMLLNNPPRSTSGTDRLQDIFAKLAAEGTHPRNLFRSSSNPKTSEWKRIFEFLAAEGMAPNLKRVTVYWDCDSDSGINRGLGKNTGFVRALARLRPEEHIKLGGFYAVNWPAFLRREIVVPVIVEEPVVGLRGFQRGTEGLNP